MAMKEQKRQKEWVYKIIVSLWNVVVNCKINGFVLTGY